MSMQSLFASVAAVLLLMVLGLETIPANAQQVFPPMGGPGGGDASDHCDPGTYLIGVHIKSGGWVDNISLICAEIHEN
jgi:hypothetical protein